jgi:hypothetical protein
MPKGSGKSVPGALLPPANPVKQMLAGIGFQIQQDGAFLNTVSLSDPTHQTIIGMTTANTRAMCRIVIDKLTNLICNIEMSGDFGQWITKLGTVQCQIPIQTQLSHNGKLGNPCPDLTPQAMNVAASMCDGLKNRIEDYIAHNGIACANLPCLMLIIDELENTHLIVDNNGEVNNAAGPHLLSRRSDLRRLFKIRAMNRAHAIIACPGMGMMSFQPALGCTFTIDWLTALR